MNITPFLAVALLALIFLQSINATSVSLNLLRTVRDPLTVTDSEVLNPKVKLGNDLIIKRVYDRRNYCKVDIDRFMLKLPEKMLVRRERLPAGVAKIGREELFVRIPTKTSSKMDQLGGKISIGEAELQVGSEYVLREFIHSDCGDRLHTDAYPDLMFQVVE